MKLTEEDLLQPCPDCHGSGQRKEDEAPAVEAHFPLPADVLLYCSTCHGTGVTPTETGEAILKLIDVARQQKRWSIH